MNNKTVGIIGGMGPHSTIRLFELIVELTPIQREQDHLRILIDNRPQIPDRTAFLLGKGPSPVPFLQESARMLETWGAELIAIACNTAHAFWQEVQNSVTIPVLNMIQLVREAVSHHVPPEMPVLLLATDGTLKTGLYQRNIPQREIIIPDAQWQAMIMEAIYGEEGIKVRGVQAPNVGNIRRVIQHYVPQKPGAIIAGCTEIELALNDFEYDIPILKPLHLLAKAIVQRACIMEQQ